MPRTATERTVAPLAEDAAVRIALAGAQAKVRRYGAFFYAAKSWRQERRVIARIEASDRGAVTLPLRIHKIRYHKLRSNPQEECKKIFEFLGLSNINVEVSSDLQKLVTSPYKEVLENYDEIARAVEGAGLAEYLPEN